MSDLKFNCPHCHQRLEVPEKALGRTISCPICKGHIRLPERPKTNSPTPAKLLSEDGTGSSARKNEIRFECATCKKHYCMETRGAGRQFKCKDCGTIILVPQPSNQTVMVSAFSITKSCGTTANVLFTADLVAKCSEGDELAAQRLMGVGPTVLSQLIEALKEEALESPNHSKGADLITDVLVSFGTVSVHSLIAKLSKSRHAYLALGRIGTDEAVKALVSELTSCNWRRAESACIGLSLVDKPGVLNYLDRLTSLSKSSRSGEVLFAAQSALRAIQSRFSGRSRNPAPASGAQRAMKR